MSDVYVLGVDMIKFGRFPDRTVPNIGAEAALMALDDAGLNIKDMQAMYCGNLGQANAMVGQRILQEIGQTGIPVVNCANACATGATAFREAWMSIKAGMYDVVLAVGVEQMGKGLLGGAGGGTGIPKEGLLGSGTMPAVFAEAGMEHTRQYGTTFEQFAKVSVKNHHHSTILLLPRKNNKSAFRSLDTGDIAKFNSNNQFILVSRDSRYIKIEDKRINLDDIEHKLQQNGVEVLCTGMDHIFIWYTEKDIAVKKIYQIIKENHPLEPPVSVIQLIALPSKKRTVVIPILQSRLIQ